VGRRGGGLAPRQLAVIRTFFVAGTVAKGLVGGCSPPRSPPPPRVVVCGEWPPPGAQGGGQGGGLTPRRPRGPHIIRHNISDSIHAGPFVLRHHPGIAVEVILAARRWAWWLFAVAEEWRVPGWPVAGGSSHVWPGTMGALSMGAPWADGRAEFLVLSAGRGSLACPRSHGFIRSCLSGSKRLLRWWLSQLQRRCLYRC